MKKNKKNAVKIRAPRGFYFKIVRWGRSQSLQVHLHNSQNDLSVGHVTLEKIYGRDQYETHSYLKEEFRGKGLGALIYSKAINWCLENGFKVRSSGSTSELAQRVWNGKSIRRFFALRKRSNCYGDPVWHARAKG